MKKIKNLFNKNLAWIVLFICIILFLALAEDVFNNEIMKGDIIGYKFISSYLINNKLTPIMKIITWFGSAVPLLLITLLLILFIKNKKVGFTVGINLVIITILNQTLKAILQRSRPSEYIIKETGYSFPSGHSMVSMAFYGYLIYLIYNNIKNKYLRTILILILSLLIFLIGLSRIYLGVHYVSDVIAGFVISIAYLIIFTKIIYKWRSQNEK